MLENPAILSNDEFVSLRVEGSTVVERSSSLIGDHCKGIGMAK